MSNESKRPSSQSITTPNVEDKLQAILAEYNALRSEIQNRSNTQSHILEIHLTTLALIIGFITANPQHLKLLILVIPIESSIFGMWYLFHKGSIEEIGSYIRNKIEPRVNKLVHCDAMLWEKYGDSDIIKRDITKSSSPFFKKFEDTTFFYPSCIVLPLTLIFIAFSVIWYIIILEKIELPSLLNCFISETTITLITFPIYEEAKEAISFFIAICGLIIGYVIFKRYRKLNRVWEKQQKSKDW